MTDFMRFMSFVGSSAFYLPLLAVVFWCVSPRVGARAAVVLAISGMLNTLLKLVFQAPRPYWTDPGVRPLESQSSFGMPSGHAQSSIVAWGYLAARLARTWAWLLAGVVIVLVGVSRVYIGVHSAGQVLAGWAIGAVLLVVVLRMEPILAPWWCDRHIAAQLGMSLAVALAFLVPTALAVESMDGWRMPDSWQRAIIAAGGRVDQVGLERGAMAAGILCGVLAGLSWLSHRGWFDPGGTLPRRAARVPVGFAGVIVISTVGLFLGHDPVTAFVVETLVGAWVTAGAPEAFVRLGLASRPTRQIPQPGEPALTRDS